MTALVSQAAHGTSERQQAVPIEAVIVSQRIHEVHPQTSANTRCRREERDSSYTPAVTTGSMEQKEREEGVDSPIARKVLRQEVRDKKRSLISFSET